MLSTFLASNIDTKLCTSILNMQIKTYLMKVILYNFKWEEKVVVNLPLDGKFCQSTILAAYWVIHKYTAILFISLHLLSLKLMCGWEKVKLLSRVWLFAIPWNVAYQAPPSMGFSRQEYWSWVPLPSLFHFPGQIYS